MNPCHDTTTRFIRALLGRAANERAATVRRRSKRLLRCYVIIDLHPVRNPSQRQKAQRKPLSHGVKLDKATHQDLGQMQMYVNYYDREVKLPDENATIGLLLCKFAKKTVVELTLRPVKARARLLVMASQVTG